jgi:hypothetical protein
MTDGISIQSPEAHASKFVTLPQVTHGAPAVSKFIQVDITTLKAMPMTPPPLTVGADTNVVAVTTVGQHKDDSRFKKRLENVGHIAKGAVVESLKRFVIKAAIAAAVTAFAGSGVGIAVAGAVMLGWSAVDMIKSGKDLFKDISNDQKELKGEGLSRSKALLQSCKKHAVRLTAFCAGVGLMVVGVQHLSHSIHDATHGAVEGIAHGTASHGAPKNEVLKGASIFLGGATLVGADVGAHAHAVADAVVEKTDHHIKHNHHAKHKSSPQGPKR